MWKVQPAMEKVDWRQVLVFFIFCLGSASSNVQGVVKPDDPFLLVGEVLVLFCNLTNVSDPTVDSEDLFFTRNGDIISDEYVDKLTTRSIRLRYPILQLQDEGHFVCYCRHSSRFNRTIGTQFVTVDYSPIKVTAIDCTVYNWEKMTCQWDLGRTYHYPENISVKLRWKIGTKTRQCPDGHMTMTSCSWDREDHFLQGLIYNMRVIVENRKRNITKRSRNFLIRTAEIVKPSPVVNLNVASQNTTCLCVEWFHQDQIHDKVANVQYHSQWNSSYWHQVEEIHFKKGHQRATICSLTPFTTYTVRVRVKPKQPGNFSERTDIDARTDPSAPDVAPEMCIGCFTEIPCTNCRKVMVYWQHIPWPLRHSVIHSYQLQYAQHDYTMDMKKAPPRNYPNTSQSLDDLRSEADYMLHLYAVTSENKLSRNHSTLIITSQTDKPEGPDTLIVETDYYPDGTTWAGKFYLSWSNASQTTSSFLVAWCKGSIFTCDPTEKNQLQWQEVSGNTTSFWIDLASEEGQSPDRPDNYIVGVARQQRRQDGVVVSSGLTWASCFYSRNAEPNVPENLELTKVYKAGSLRVTWKYKECDNKGRIGYVAQFIIHYCITSSVSGSCTGKEYIKTVGRETRNVLLEGLEPGARYSVSMEAQSLRGMKSTSKRSQSIQARAAELIEQDKADSESTNVVFIVLGVVVVIVITICIIIKLRSHILKSKRKFNGSSQDQMLFPDNPSNVGHFISTAKRQQDGKDLTLTCLMPPVDNTKIADDDRCDGYEGDSVMETSKLLASSATQETPPARNDSHSGCSSVNQDSAMAEGDSELVGNVNHDLSQVSPVCVPNDVVLAENDSQFMGDVHREIPQTPRPSLPQTTVRTSNVSPDTSSQPCFSIPNFEHNFHPSSAQTGYDPTAVASVLTTGGVPLATFTPQAEGSPLLSELCSNSQSQCRQSSAHIDAVLDTMQFANFAPPSLSTVPGGKEFASTEGLAESCTEIKQYAPMEESFSDLERPSLLCIEIKQYASMEESFSSTERPDLSCIEVQKYLPIGESSSGVERPDLSSIEIKQYASTEESFSGTERPDLSGIEIKQYGFTEESSSGTERPESSCTQKKM